MIDLKKPTTIKLAKPKVKVLFTEKAWVKMQTLIKNFSTEVAWHGLAARGKKPFEYIIYDILVYPQEVSGATVTTDQSEYEKWLMGLGDREFNNLRMQGHSHVEMSPSPSPKDRVLYNSITEQLGNDMFYIFLIWNKQGDGFIEIHDRRENKVFHSSDITVSVKWSVNAEKFLKQARALVKESPTKLFYNKIPKRRKI